MISYGSIEQYKGRQIDPGAVGRELGVSAIMIGRISKRDDVITIGAELIDARDKTRIWGEQEKVKFSEFEDGSHASCPQRIRQARPQLATSSGKRWTPKSLRNGPELLEPAHKPRD